MYLFLIAKLVILAMMVKCIPIVYGFPSFYHGMVSTLVYAVLKRWLSGLGLLGKKTHEERERGTTMDLDLFTDKE